MKLIKKISDIKETSFLDQLDPKSMIFNLWPDP